MPTFPQLAKPNESFFGNLLNYYNPVTNSWMHAEPDFFDREVYGIVTRPSATSSVDDESSSDDDDEDEDDSCYSLLIAAAPPLKRRRV